MVRTMRCLGFILGPLALGACFAAAADVNRLSVEPPAGAAWPRFSISTLSNRVVRLEASGDLETWQEIARSHDVLISYPDMSATEEDTRFYRASIVPRTAVDDWKNQARFPDDSLLSPAPAYGEILPRWIKFVIVLADPHRVHFQDSSKYSFHYDFARARLAPFQSFTREQFDAVSLWRANQQVVLGTVLFGPTTNLREIGIQFVGNDPYPPEQVADWFDRVRASLVAGPEVKVFYFPTYEQQGAAELNRPYFDSRGIAISSGARWVIADQCYAAGWALGRLVHVPAAELDAYYRDGRLRPDDILVVETVPSKIPPVAGIVSIVPTTPNSHVALLAQSFGIPCVYFADAASRDWVLGLLGQEVVLLARSNYGACDLRIASVEGQLSDDLRLELLALKTPPALELTPKITSGTIGISAEGLRPADIARVGGKAANFGLLRRAIPAYAPTPALALTFDLWDAYLDQTLPTGTTTLRAAIDAKLSGYSWPPEMAAVQDALAEVRTLFTDIADFDPAQRQAILTLLDAAGFAPDRKIRFRSSTNVEDSEQFSGAGLYDSYSGCLADELDGDDAGPSQCDPSDSRERGVFRALRKVYASFFNQNAFLERLRHRVDEADVGMAVLVHHSTPDEFELANGVATAEIWKGDSPNIRSFSARLVTQLGALSVANPEANAWPEEVKADIWSDGAPYLSTLRSSSLVPLGDHVLAWETEYRDLAIQLDKAARAYEAEFPERRTFLLDFEYKKIAPEGRLLVKQIRELPQPSNTTTLTPWLLNQTNRYVLAQGEHGNAFAFHRLKSRWTLTTGNLRLTDANLADTIYRTVNAELLDGMAVSGFGGLLSDLPEFAHCTDGEYTIDSWALGTGKDRRVFELQTWLPRQVSVNGGPIVLLSDGTIFLKARYAQPQPVINYDGPDATSSDEATLTPARTVSPLSLLQTRKLAGKGITVDTRFYWPPNPTGPTAGYTAPLEAWVETRIEGLASQVIVLRHDLAQTYHPGHHNFFEEFIFDPHLEPGIDPTILSELAARNIRALYGTWSFDTSTTFWIWGLDNTLRRL
ncbi:MAG: phosphoenolpyruvate synthase [Verrucomicrobia bacterium ADurb.Bin006]|nr:MAG: phosphoenolpyruvate synthase [Verrucomicrobia bacterium ADurb.Bin006]